MALLAVLPQLYTLAMLRSLNSRRALRLDAEREAEVQFQFAKEKVRYTALRLHEGNAEYNALHRMSTIPSRSRLSTMIETKMRRILIILGQRVAMYVYKQYSKVTTNVMSVRLWTFSWEIVLQLACIVDKGAIRADKGISFF